MTDNSALCQDLYTAKEAATRLRVSVRTLDRLIANGKLVKASLPIGRTRIPGSEIERLMTPLRKVA